MLKTLFALSALLISNSLWANDDLAAKKQEITKDLDARISRLQEAKTCIAGAQTHDAIKNCHETLKKANEAFEALRKERKTHQIEDRIKKLEEEKAKLINPTSAIPHR